VSVAVVVPTIREECALRWIDEWKDDLRDARVIFVEDNPEPTFAISGAEHYSWRDFAELGGDEWIIPRRTSACRSYGFLKALQGDADIIWTTDDDCYPEEARKGSFLRELESVFTTPPASGDVMDGWWNTISSAGIYPRGYPYGIRRQVMVHHGLWSNVPDLDGITQLANPGLRLGPAQRVDVVPDGAFFPFCIMNVAFRREATPLLYMLLMGQDQQGERWGFDRFDDIWAGLFLKKTADHLGWAITSGAPSVHHSRASDPHRNAELEAPGIRAHEDFWQHIRDVKLTGATPSECYAELAGAAGSFRGGSPREGYWMTLAAAMRLWAEHAEKAS
jgi:reversibly glycosylated polypeptide / UDP-arabinopyranose mutase